MGSGSSTSKPKKVENLTELQKKYALGDVLGSGAYSVVKLGTNKSNGQKVAVKIVNTQKLSDQDLIGLRNEINILKVMQHPNIIRLYEVFEEPIEHFIITELVSGGELFDRIVAKSHYTEKEARDLVKIFLETMAYMHENGVVHRDLKPENLLLCSDVDDTSIKIADFGFAKRITELADHEPACGTPGYVAPEILRGDPYHQEVDIWSMGVIIYVLLAGYPPFYDEDQKKLFRKIKEARYHFHEDYWQNISPEAMDLIRMMLKVSQKDRWTARQLLSHKWITLGDDQLKTRDLTGSITEMKRFNARRRLRAAANAVIMTNRINNMLGAAGVGEKDDDVAPEDLNDDKPEL